MSILLSIVTPTLNAAHTLSGCIQSVRKESGADIEIEHIVVDGGSEDNTLSVAKEGKCRIVADDDKGIFDAIDRGTKAASGNIVGFLGADDRLLPGAGLALSSWYAQRKSPWVTAPVLWVDGDGRSLGLVRPPPLWMPVEMYASLGWNCIWHMSSYFTGSFYQSVGGFDSSYAYCGDYDFFARALRLHRPDYLSRALACFTRHGANASMSADSRRTQENERVANVYGPTNPYVLYFYRQTLRCWINIRNPTWAVTKVIGRNSILAESTR